MDVVGVQVANSYLVAIEGLGGPFMDEAGEQIEPNTRDDCPSEELNSASGPE